MHNRIVNKIPEMDQEPDLDLSTPAEQAQLLQQVLQASDKDLEDEDVLDEEGNPVKVRLYRYLSNHLFSSQVTRKETNISVFSGGSSASYIHNQKPKNPLFKFLRR